MFSKVELITTAAVSFGLGWTLRSLQVFQRIGASLMYRHSNDMKMAIVVRPDLSMSKGKIASQCCHAAVLCCGETMKNFPERARIWLSKGQAKIILKSDYPGEEGLKRLQKKAREVGLVAVIVRDAGRTQLPSGSATALGIGPGEISKVDEVTSTLKVL